MAKVRSIMAEKLEKATKTYQEMARKYRIRTEITNDMKNKILDLKERNNDQQGLYKQEFENLTVYFPYILGSICIERTQK